VYADILILINFFVNYLLLRADAVLNNFNFKVTRLIIASLIGSIFSLIIFIEDIPPILNIAIKLIYIILMLFSAFKIRSLKSFAKHFMTFIAINFIFAGIMLAINIFLFPNTSIYNNGIVYFDINIFTLSLISVLCYIIISVLSKFIKLKTPDKSIYTIRIKYNGKISEGCALFDSGNTLCDCFSGKPVVIAEKEFINKILCDSEIENLRNFRLIPFSTINGNGTIPAFMADSVDINIGGKWIKSDNIYIGITDKKIISGGYYALIGTPYFETVADDLNIIHGGKL